MASEMPLLYTILCGIILVLSVMVAITCLLVHHNHHLRRLHQDAKENRTHTRRGTHRKAASIGKVATDDYVLPRQIPRSHPPPDFHSPQPPVYLEPINKQYENVSVDSESGHSYESLGNFHA